MNETPNQALQRTPGFGVQLPGAALIRPAQSRAVLPAMKPGTARAFALRRRAQRRAPGPESLSLGSLGDTRVSREMKTSFFSIAAETGAIGCPALATQSAGLRAARRSGSMTVVLTPVCHLVAVPVSPNHALQRTPGFGVQLPGAALIRPAQSRAVLPAMKPGTARAFALRRRAHSRAPGPESLSLGSLGD